MDSRVPSDRVGVNFEEKDYKPIYIQQLINYSKKNLKKELNHML